MRNHYRELAMAKTHVEYWLHVANSSSSDLTQRAKGYDEHLRSQAYAREIEQQIKDTKAEYIGYVWKFEVLESVGKSIEEQLTKMSNFKYEKAKSYGNHVSHTLLRYELIEQDEKKLRENYFQNLAPFKKINDILHVTAAKLSKKRKTRS